MWVSGDERHGGELCLSFELQNGRASVPTHFEPINSQCELDRMYEPDLPDTGALVSGNFHKPVMPSGTRRKNFGDPLGRNALVGPNTGPPAVELPTGRGGSSPADFLLQPAQRSRACRVHSTLARTDRCPVARPSCYRASPARARGT